MGRPAHITMAPSAKEKGPTMLFLSFLSFMLVMSIVGTWFYGLGIAIGIVGVVLFMAAGLLIALFSPAKKEPASEPAAESLPEPTPEPEPEQRRVLATCEPCGDEPYPSASFSPRYSIWRWPIELYERPDGGILAVVDPDRTSGRMPWAYRFDADGRPLEGNCVVPVWHPAKRMFRYEDGHDDLKHGTPRANVMLFMVDELNPELDHIGKYKTVESGSKSIRY